MTEFRISTIDAQQTAAVRKNVPMAELTTAFDTGFSQVMQAVTEQGATVTGPPFGYYHSMPGETIDVSIGFPVSSEVRAGDVQPFELPGGQAVVGTHVGPYDQLEGLELAEGMWEQYVSDPSAEPDPATWRTLIVWPLA